MSANSRFVPVLVALVVLVVENNQRCRHQKECLLNQVVLQLELQPESLQTELPRFLVCLFVYSVEFTIQN